MKKERIVAIALAFTVASSAVPTALFAQQSTSLAGTAKDEAKKPYTDYTVGARDVNAPKGEYVKSVALDNQGAFSLADLSTKSYLVELVNKKGEVVCTEGPFDLSKQAIKSDVFIDCGKVPVAWWLVGAAAAAGVAAGIAAGDASPSR